MKYRDPQVTKAAFRAAFFSYLYELAPEVMADLKRLGPQYKELFGTQFFNTQGRAGWILLETETLDGVTILDELTGDPRYFHISEPDLTEDERSTVDAVLNLRRKLNAFISKYGLTTKWLRLACLETLREIARNPGLKGPMFCIESRYGFINDPPEFRLPRWQPASKSLRDYRKVATDQFKLVLNQYVDEITKMASTAYESAKGRPYDTTRVKWLIRWTVQRRTVAEIAWEFNTEERAVWQAFESFKEFDLPVRRKMKDTEL